jgi:hypothetical protein
MSCGIATSTYIHTCAYAPFVIGKLPMICSSMYNATPLPRGGGVVVGGLQGSLEKLGALPLTHHEEKGVVIGKFLKTMETGDGNCG